MGVTCSIILVFITFAASYCLAPWVVRWCVSHNIVARISARSLHTTPTPHGGGVLPVALSWVGMLAYVVCVQPPHMLFLLVLLACALPVAYVGWMDDKAEQTPLTRLLVHVGAVVVAVFFLPQLFHIVPFWVEKLVLILAWAWFVNLFNFMDGLDGFATSEAIFISLALALLVPPLAPLACILAVAFLGFLRVNWQPAKIFLGDIGSTYLGFMLGGLLFVALEWNTWVLVWPLFTITLVFSADATYTLFKRIFQGHKPWHPHREFFAHRAADKLGSHKAVVFRMLALNVCLLGFVLLEIALGVKGLSLICGCALLSAVAWRIYRLK